MPSTSKEQDLVYPLWGYNLSDKFYRTNQIHILLGLNTLCLGNVMFLAHKGRLDCMYEWHDGCLIKSRNCLPFAITWVHSRFLLVWSVFLIFLIFFCVVILCFFTFWVPCCGVHYDFSMKTMFGSYLSPVVCRRARVLFTVFVFLRIVMSNIYCAVLFSSSCVPYAASFSNVYLQLLQISTRC